MLLARMHPAMTWAKVKTGPPATPNVVAVAIATTVVTAAAMNAPTMLSRAILLSVVSHGPTGAMTADQIATAAPTKMHALTDQPTACHALTPIPSR